MGLAGNQLRRIMLQTHQDISSTTQDLTHIHQAQRNLAKTNDNNSIPSILNSNSSTTMGSLDLGRNSSGSSHDNQTNSAPTNHYQEKQNATMATNDYGHLFELPKMDNFVDLFSLCCSTAVIFGGLIPYIPQYLKIKRSMNSDGFSTYGECLRRHPP